MSATPDVRVRAESLYRKIREIIHRTGRCVIAVDAEAGTAPFAYTVGPSLRGLPELLIVGAEPKHAQGCLNRLGDIQDALRAPLYGDVHIGGRYPVRLVPLPDPEDAGERYLRAAPAGAAVTQVLISDLAGVYPDEPGCDPRYVCQVEHTLPVESQPEGSP